MKIVTIASYRTFDVEIEDTPTELQLDYFTSRLMANDIAMDDSGIVIEEYGAFPRSSYLVYIDQELSDHIQSLPSFISRKDYRCQSSLNCMLHKEAKEIGAWGPLRFFVSRRNS